jgi:hypothetical protein
MKTFTPAGLVRISSPLPGVSSNVSPVIPLTFPAAVKTGRKQRKKKSEKTDGFPITLTF